MNDRNIKLANLIKEVAATFIQQEANLNPLITVTRVDVSPDGHRVIIFFTTIPDGKENDALIFLKRHSTELRNYLKRKARLKRIPHIECMIDAGERQRQHLDELVKGIDEKK